jgi:hypothetical protein
MIEMSGGGLSRRPRSIRTVEPEEEAKEVRLLLLQHLSLI